MKGRSAKRKKVAGSSETGRRPMRSGGYHFSHAVQQTVRAARLDAERAGSTLSPERMLLALLEMPDESCAAMLRACTLDVDRASRRLRTILDRRAEPAEKRERRAAAESKRTRLALEGALVAAASASSPTVAAKGNFFVETPHLLLGTLIDHRSIGPRLLLKLGVARSDLELALIRSRENLEIRLDEKSDKTLTEQIVAQVAEAVAAGRVSAGHRLPTIRQLASDLELAPGTVSRAYAILESQGVVRTNGSQGTFVATLQEGGIARDPKVGELLRAAVIGARNAGMIADDLRLAFERAMEGIYPA